MKRYWVSWTSAELDYRPLNYPPSDGIMGWWCSGRDGNDNANLCALVDATSPKAARATLGKDWPETKGRTFRFFDEVERDWRPSNRFPLSPWMKRRLNK